MHKFNAVTANPRGDDRRPPIVSSIISFTLLVWRRAARICAQAPFRFHSVFIICLAASAAGYGQVPAASGSSSETDLPGPDVAIRAAGISTENWIASYLDPVQGSSSIDLVRRALTANAQLAAARLDIDRARARLSQAGLRPNPSLDIEQQNGVFNSPGERGTS